MAARGEEGCGLGGKGEGTKKYKPAVIKQSRDVAYSTGSIAHDTVITVCGVRRVPDSRSRSLWKLHKCLNTMLCI